MKLLKEIKIEPNKVFTDGQFNADLSGKTLVEIYRHICGTYPKFFKMDGLCKLGFVAAEWLLSDVSAEDKANSSVILFNHGGSVYTDAQGNTFVTDCGEYKVNVTTDVSEQASDAVVSKESGGPSKMVQLALAGIFGIVIVVVVVLYVKKRR